MKNDDSVSPKDAKRRLSGQGNPDRTTRRDFFRRGFEGAVSIAAMGLGFSSARAQTRSPAIAAPAASSPMSLRGLMADAARVPEDVSYYRRLIDFSREWNLNSLLFSLTDDQGSALRFRSHPELLTHQHALTPEEARALAEYGEKRGVEIIPIVESFGHTHYITAVPRYAHLADRPPGGRGNFDGVIPVAPETLRLMHDLYQEAAAIFPGRYFHGGCDEVSWGGSELSRKALETRTRAEIWAGYLNSLDEIAQGAGKEFIVWGDYVLHKEPQILPLLSKNIVVMDWQYSVTDPQPLEQAARRVMAHGLRAIGAPAIISCRWGPRAGADALRNLAAYADAYRSIADARALGVIVTNWVPSRYIQQSIWDSFAYAAVALSEGGERARATGFRRFVERHYGARWNRNWAGIFEKFYYLAPSQPHCAPAGARLLLPIPWRNEAGLKAALAGPPGESVAFARLFEMIKEAESSVRRNGEDFRAFELSATYLEYLFSRDAATRERFREGSLTRESAARWIETVAGRDRQMLGELDAAWNQGRPSDSAAKLGPLFDFGPGDQLLFTFRQAAQFSAQLASNPDRFYRMMAGRS